MHRRQSEFYIRSFTKVENAKNYNWGDRNFLRFDARNPVYLALLSILTVYSRHQWIPHMTSF